VGGGTPSLSLSFLFPSLSPFPSPPFFRVGERGRREGGKRKERERGRREGGKRKEKRKEREREEEKEKGKVKGGRKREKERKREREGERGEREIFSSLIIL
jgi:hypothetical protein